MEIQVYGPQAPQPEFHGPSVGGGSELPVGSRGNAQVGDAGGGKAPGPKTILRFQEPSISLLLKLIWTYLSSNSIEKVLSNTKQFNIKTYFT